MITDNMDSIRIEIRSILSFLNYYNAVIPDARRTVQALNKFLNLLDNCPPSCPTEEELWDTLQICRILGNRDHSHKDRLNQLLSQVFRNDPHQNSHNK